jgi:prepilin-type N-terminal cleavage/methylation domain-containing protein
MKLPLTTHRRLAFTLVELLIVLTIVAILSGMALAALSGAAEEGRRQRARAQIEKLDQLISEKWNSYRFRQLPIRISPTLPPLAAATLRLNALRELMRMELPDRLTDVIDDRVILQTRPALNVAYNRRVTPLASTTLSYDQAEMLYLIVAEMKDGDRGALNAFAASEVGDTDGDGMNELLDPWGTPIMFLRWAPGYSRATISDPELAGQLNPPYPQPQVAVDTFQLPNGNLAPDPYDPLKVDARWADNTPGAFRPFQMRPLIFSAGPDKVYDIYIDPASTAFHYSTTTPPNDPYAYIVDSGVNHWMGEPADANGDGSLQHGDNVTNHSIVLEGE